MEDRKHDQEHSRKDDREQDDLDALIGDIRREAARRRAAPDFPLDHEARLSVAMDRQGPTGPGVDLDAVLSDLDALGKPEKAAASTTDRAGRRRPPPPPPEVARIAELAGAALRGLAARVADVQRRLDRDRPKPAPGPAPGGPAAPSDLRHWIDRVAAMSTGRVLVAGAGAGEWLAQLAHLTQPTQLSGPGLDVYGVDPSLADFADNGPLRSGQVAAHLDHIEAGGLGTAVLLHPPGGARPQDLAATLNRAAATVVVVSEAPWSWYRRVGPPACDTSPDRPVLAETWMALLSDAGFAVSAEYGPGGHDYLVRGEKRQ